MPKPNVTVNYALAVPEQGPSSASSLDSLVNAFVETAVTYYDTEIELQRSVNRGDDAKALRDGTSASANRKGPSAQGAGEFDTGKRRASIASSIRAVNTRVGKFGDTKLKATTVDTFRRKGFQVGVPNAIPNRVGQNKPRGQS